MDYYLLYVEKIFFYFGVLIFLTFLADREVDLRERDRDFSFLVDDFLVLLFDFDLSFLTGVFYFLFRVLGFFLTIDLEVERLIDFLRLLLSLFFMTGVLDLEVLLFILTGVLDLDLFFLAL